MNPSTNSSSVILGVGAYLPDRVMTNLDLEKIVETNDAWIRERTGITQRHIVAEGERTSDMATKAAQKALAAAGVDASQIDAILVATSTPDQTMPSTATIVQRKLGITNGLAMDLAAACTGFVYGLGVAHGLLATGQAKTLLLIGAESMSRIVDWNDRGTCILFGDGAGAVVLQHQDVAGQGILYSKLYADGSLNEILYTTGGVSQNQQAGVLWMAGQEVFRHAVAKMADSVIEGVAATGHTLSDIDLVVGHQANARILQSIAKRLSLSPDKCIMTLDKHANTSAASIPLALDVAVAQGKLRKGMLVALPALGAGLTWGCCIIKW